METDPSFKPCRWLREVGPPHTFARQTRDQRRCLWIVGRAVLWSRELCRGQRNENWGDGGLNWVGAWVDWLYSDWRLAVGRCCWDDSNAQSSRLDCLGAHGRQDWNCNYYRSLSWPPLPRNGDILNYFARPHRNSDTLKGGPRKYLH